MTDRRNSKLMTLRYLAPKIVIVLGVIAMPVFAQDGQDDSTGTRGVFMSSRPGTSETASNTSATAKTGSSRTSSGRAGSSTAHPRRSKAARSAADPNAVGMGYTLYMADANGDAVRVDPDREFTNGERIRFSFEPNSDGYLYVFDVENNSQAKMIFPDIQLNEGKNNVQAHVPYEVPSNVQPDERLRYFAFDANAGMEHVYIVLTRRPLPNVPTAAQLTAYCRSKKAPCTWQPSAAVWSQIQSAASAPVLVSKSNDDRGKPETATEKEATTRGLGLPQDAPEPSVVRMNASSATGTLVTVINLVHK